VGKSALFSRLTGIHAISSNYPGTTVGFLEGLLFTPEGSRRLIDVPGAYTLEATNEAEAIAARIIDEGADAAILVLDATALERSLYVALETLERGIPSVAALNLVDEARHRGITVDSEALARELGIPVVPTVAVTGQGLKELVARIGEARTAPFRPVDREVRWGTVGRIAAAVQRAEHRHHTWRDRLEDAAVSPFWGALMGVAVLAGSFALVRTIGEGLIDHLFDPLFEGFWRPLLGKLSIALGPGWPRDLLIGRLFGGEIDFEQSFGLLSTGVYVELAMVLPYILAFYGMLSLLEDTGYLPRLAVLCDALLHRVGIHGYAIIPTLLGLGCNVPGILATRALESPRERFIAATLISVAVPCTALQAMVVGSLGKAGAGYVAAVYGTLFASWFVLGRILHLTLPGYSPELIVEIPPWRWPSLQGFALKLWFRTKDFLIEATPLVLGGILLVHLLTELGAMTLLARLLGPLFRGLLDLPPAAAGPIVMGLFRKDVAVGMLIPLGLTPDQMLVAVVMLAMTFPCIATFVVLIRELGTRGTLKATALMGASALLAGSLVRAVLAALH
jgi:ferrous iron transport protein B